MSHLDFEAANQQSAILETLSAPKKRRYSCTNDELLRSIPQLPKASMPIDLNQTYEIEPKQVICDNQTKAIEPNETDGTHSAKHKNNNDGLVGDASSQDQFDTSFINFSRGSCVNCVGCFDGTCGEGASNRHRGHHRIKHINSKGASHRNKRKA